jgi:WD40 repeat protein
VNRVLVLAALAVSAHAAPPVTAVAFTPDGRFVVSGGHQRFLVWNAQSNKLERTIGGFSGRVRALAFVPDGQTLAVAEGVPGRSGAVSLVDFASGAITNLAKADDEMLAVAFSADGKLVAAGGTNNTVEIWSVADRKPVATLKGHTGWITGIAFSPDGKFLATSSLDKTVRIWDPAKWTERIQLPQTATGEINGVAIAPEGDILVFAEGSNEEHSLRIWRTQNNAIELDPNRPNLATQRVQTRPLDTGTCIPLAVTFVPGPPHSRMIAACSDHTLRLFGPNGNTFPNVTGHTDWVYSVAASADGKWFASGSGDGTVKIWTAANGKLANTLTEASK